MRTEFRDLLRTVYWVIIVVTVILTGGLNAQVSQAATYYVATTGSDSSSCSQAQNVATPKRTIASGLTCLSAGSTLYIRSGTYSEAITNSVPIPSGTSWTSPVTIAAYPGESVTLRPTSGQQVISIEAYSVSQYVIFDGLILDGINLQTIYSDGVKIRGGSHHIRFQNGEIKNTWRNGVLIVADASGSSGFNEFINSKVHDGSLGCASIGGCYGFYIQSNNNLVDGVEIYNFDSYGIHIYNANTPYPSNNIVRNSVVRNNGSLIAWSSGILIAKGNGNMAYNNIVRNGNHGIAVGFGASNSYVYNNTVFGNLYNGVDIGDSGASNAIVRNNISFQNGSSNIYVRSTASGTIQSNNLTTDPKFVNAAANDFRLQSASPAINTGISLAEVPTDFIGTVRPQGVGYDVGAYEYNTGGATLSAPSQLVVSP